MPPSQPARRATQSNLDDVDEYIETRRARWLHAVPDEGSRRRRDLMGADFSWSEPPPRRGRERVHRPKREEELPRSGSGASRSPSAPSADGLAPYRAPEAPLPTAEPVHDRYTDQGHERYSEPGRDGYAKPDHDRYAEPPAPAPSGGRRTIVITGHGAERQARIPARGPSRAGGYESRLPLYERASFRADRTAMWAVLLCLALLLAAATSSHAAVLHVLHAGAQLH